MGLMDREALRRWAIAQMQQALDPSGRWSGGGWDDDPPADPRGWSSGGDPYYRRQPPRRRSPRPAVVDARWVPAGEPVTVAGYDIPGGLLYVGSGLPAVRGHEIERALIDPRLKVDRARPSAKPEGTAYWPAYREFSPGARAGYLQWLAGGRRDPQAAPAYVLLFFYGLERRLFAPDDGVPVDAAERETIVAEVARLFELYGNDWTFRSHAERFLDCALLFDPERRLYRTPPAVRARGWEPPLALRIALGQLALDREPLPAEWAHAWLIHHPEVRLRTPAQRCPAEFRTLFCLRYREQFGAGIMIRPGRRPLAVSYYPANPIGGVTIQTNLTDIAHTMRPIGKLLALAERCSDELDPFSRWRGRNPTGPVRIDGAAYLPDALLEHADGDQLAAFRETIEAWLAGADAAPLAAAKLIERWPVATPGKLGKPEAVALSLLLERLGYGAEPDVRFSGIKPEAPGRVLLFRLGDGPPATPSPAYAAAATFLQFAVLVAAADGPLNAAEEASIEDHLRTSAALAVAERRRMNAHLWWLLRTPPKLAAARGGLAALDELQRRRLVRFLLRVAGADGQVGPPEIELLRKVYTALGRRPDDLYTDLHRQAGGDEAASDEPASIRLPGAPATGYRIPAPRRPGLRLDHAAIERKQRETAAVTELLTGIFAEDEPAHAPATSPAGGAAGLDAPHAALLRRLAERPRWQRAEVEALAAELRLLPDGALEAINDAAFELCGAPVCEGDEAIDVDQAGAAAMLEGQAS